MLNRQELQGLRSWTEIHIDEHIPHLTGYHKDALYYNCTIDNLKGAVCVDCCFTASKFNIEKVEDLLGCCLTLDCATFSELELSPLAFDYMLLLMLRGKGNTEKRLKLIDALGGQQHVYELLNAHYPGNTWWEK